MWSVSMQTINIVKGEFFKSLITARLTVLAHGGTKADRSEVTEETP